MFAPYPQKTTRMISNNIVSVQLTPEEVGQAVQRLKEINDQLGNQLVALQPAQRMEMLTVSDRSMPFLEKVVAYVDSRPEFVPFFLSVEDLKIDFKAVSDLKLIAREAEQLCQALNDTILLSGSEAYTAALAYYRSVKGAAQANVPHAQAVYEDLRKRFERRPRRSNADPATEEKE